MRRYFLSEEAKLDLREIARFTRKTWGNAQARRYVVRLRDFCQTLADTPGLGRPFPFRGLLRMEHGSHVMFYRKTESGILIVRIVHQRMLPEGKSLSEE